MTFYKFAKNIVFFISRFFHKVEYYGLDKVPQNKGYILCCNHRTFWDVIFLAAPINKQIYFMAKKELFKFPPIAFVLKKLGVISVNRGVGDKTPIETSINLIKNNKIVGIFPEGTRSHDNQLLRPKVGAAFITYQTKSDVLPVGIVYEEPIRFRSKIKVTYGDIIRFQDFNFENASRSEVKSASKMIMEHIEKCRG